MLRGVHELDDLCPLDVAQGMRWVGFRTSAAVPNAWPSTPAGDRRRRQTDGGACPVQRCAIGHGLVDELEQYQPLVCSVSSSSSPQISATFFLSTMSAAISASAFSLRARSALRLRISVLGA